MEVNSSGTKPAVALLIDGENVNPSVLEAMWKKIGEAGVLRVKCLIGNFRSSALGLWKDAEAKYGLDPIQATVYVAGKNTSDSRLIIEAMRLYYETDIRTFVIMSSDSDFTQLALFLREKGACVIGIGLDSAPCAWRCAVTDYWGFVPPEGAFENDASAQGALTDETPHKQQLVQEKTLRRWIETFCAAHHGPKGWTLIGELESLLDDNFRIDYGAWRAENLADYLKAHPERYQTQGNRFVKVLPG